MKKYIKYISMVILVFIIANVTSATAYAASEAPSVTGDSLVVMDASTGVVVYGKDENTQYPPASTTKLMTILLTLENCDLNEIVTVGDYPPTIEGSKIYVDRTEQMTVEEMLYAVIMVSANDCAASLAEHISGSIEEFAKLMNSRAKELGCLNTNFCNPHGLYEDTHRTTTYDLALMEKELLKFPKYIEISQTKSTTLKPTNIFSEERPLWNDNRLLHDYYSCYYPNVVAGKTGYTDESLHSFVASAKKDNQEFIIAILHDEFKAYYNETPGVFDWAFANFATTKAVSKNEELNAYETSNGTTIPLMASEDIYYTKDITTDTEPTIKIDTDSLNGKFFKANDVVTTATITYGNQNYTVDVISKVDYFQETLPLLGTFLTSDNNTINYTELYLLIGGGIASVIVLAIILSMIVRKIIYNKAKKKLYKSYYNKY